MPQFTQGVDILPKTWPSSPHDHLPLPGGGTVGTTPTDALFRILAGAKIPGVSAENGRGTNIDRYAAHLDRVSHEAKTAGINAWLAEVAK